MKQFLMATALFLSLASFTTAQVHHPVHHPVQHRRVVHHRRHHVVHHPVHHAPVRH